MWWLWRLGSRGSSLKWVWLACGRPVLKRLPASVKHAAALWPGDNPEMVRTWRHSLIAGSWDPSNAAHCAIPKVACAMKVESDESSLAVDLALSAKALLSTKSRFTASSGKKKLHFEDHLLRCLAWQSFFTRSHHKRSDCPADYGHVSVFGMSINYMCNIESQA